MIVMIMCDLCVDKTGLCLIRFLRFAGLYVDIDKEGEGV